MISEDPYSQFLSQLFSPVSEINPISFEYNLLHAINLHHFNSIKRYPPTNHIKNHPHQAILENFFNNPNDFTINDLSITIKNLLHPFEMNPKLYISKLFIMLSNMLGISFCLITSENYNFYGILKNNTIFLYKSPTGQFFMLALHGHVQNPLEILNQIQRDFKLIHHCGKPLTIDINFSGTGMVPYKECNFCRSSLPPSQDSLLFESKNQENCVVCSVIFTANNHEIVCYECQHFLESTINQSERLKKCKLCRLNEVIDRNSMLCKGCLETERLFNK